MSLFATSAPMRRVVEDIARAAGQPAHVLLIGEAGTGRTLVAQAIHARSRDSAGPFVAVDCAQSPQDLEAQLFGSAGHRGPVERRTLERVRASAQLLQSKGGTLYLQNAVELPARFQMRLVRVMRDREVVVAESGARVELDHRVISSADGALDSAVLEGRLLADLHRRLSGLRIEVPALRDRSQDIPALAVHLLTQLCDRESLPQKHLSDAAISVLAALPWRGNGNELSALLEVLATRTASAAITLDDLLRHVSLDGRTTSFPVGGTLRQARARFESEYIAAVLARHSGSIPRAARTLGIQRSNLYRKIRHLRVKAAPGRPAR